MYFKKLLIDHEANEVSHVQENEIETKETREENVLIKPPSKRWWNN